MKMYRLSDYRGIISDNDLYRINKKADKLYGKRVIHINSSHMDGGIASMLSSLVPLKNDVSIEAGWRILHADTDFYSISNKFRDAIYGEKINMSKNKKNLFIETSEKYAAYTHLEQRDNIIVHDFQPLPLVNFYKKKNPWLWRCHVDLNTPNPELWKFMKRFILKYDMIVLSSEKSANNDLPLEYRIIPPGIDPLSPKNKTLPGYMISNTLEKYRIPVDKPIITQIARYDKWKDPLGVIDIYKKVKKKIDCRLVLCGNITLGNPNGYKVFEKLHKRANHLVETGDIILRTTEDDILVNTLQRISAVIIQKSFREGFGLTVTEALWKEKPVIASDTGGIPLQIRNGYNGYIVDPQDLDGFVDRAVELLKYPSHANEFGANAKKTVHEKFLITRVLSDYMDLLHEFS